MKKKTKLLIGTALICPLLLALILVVALVVVPHFTNKFRIDVVDNISLGASKEEVRTKLGDPYLEEKTRWGYGDKKLCSYLEDAQEISTAMEEAILRGDLERVERLNRQYENLMDEVASKKFSYIEVNFEDDAVVSVLLDKAYALEPGYKKVKEDKLTWSGLGYASAEVILPYYIDYTQSSAGVMRRLDCTFFANDIICYNGRDLTCATTFTDGSFYRSYVKSFEVKDDWYFVWSDNYVDHKASHPYNFPTPHYSTSPAVDLLGEISDDGIWHWSSLLGGKYQNIIKSITLSESVAKIEGLFHGLNLESIDVVEENPNYSSQDGILYNKEKTEIIVVPPRAKGAVTIPEGVTEIKPYAFNGCTSLTKVTFEGNSRLTSIGDSAFNRIRDTAKNQKNLLKRSLSRA